MPEEPRYVAILASFSGNGGVERMLVNLILALTARGVRIDLLLLRAESSYLRELPDDIAIIRLRRHRSPLRFPAIARYLRTHRPQALLVAKDRAGRSAVIARALAGTATPLLLRIGTHLSTAMAQRSPVERWLRYSAIRLLYPRIDAVVAVSDGVAEDVGRVSGLPAERIHVVRNPVVTPRLAARAAEPCTHPWFAAPPPQGEIPVILGIGRLQRQKDFPTLLRAFALLRRQMASRLLILGEGRGRSRLEALIGELGLQDAVELPGFAPNPYPLLARAHLFVLSSAWEGSPNVLTEALALGTPVVSTDCPSGPKEILEDGRYGPLVPVGDPESLAAAMRRTLENPLPAEVLRAAVVEYDAAVSADRYLDLLNRIAAHRTLPGER